MKKILIAGNWKMNTNVFESRKLAEYILGGIQKYPDLKVETLVCPPFTSIEAVAEVSEGTPLMYGAQNCHQEPKGAFTGEVSLPMLKHLHCSHVITGHSERRQYFGETDELINSKARKIIEYDMKAIICIGETLEERQSGKTFDILQSQLDKCLDGFGPAGADDIIIAYEPVWAIGTGVAAKPEQVEEAHSWLREYIHGVFKEKADNVILLYGGSMKPENADTLLGLRDVNGGLIGGASLDPEKFLEIIEIATKYAG